MTEYVYPQKITESRFAAGEGALLKKQPLQIGLSERETAEISDGGHLILDFGKEMNGGIRLLVFLSDRCTVRIRFGE
ncbi:MAG: alpha-L-rhamnosidase, partial [Candidatus Gallimonas sp.]